MRYFFILGKHPALSIAEIQAVFMREGIPATVSRSSSEAMVVETTARIDEEFFYGLGGSVKFGEVVVASSREALRGRLVHVLKQIRLPSKFIFGFSIYSLEDGVSTGKLRRDLARIGIEIKKELKGLGPVRFVTSREPTLSSVVIQTNHATELVVLQGPETLLIGKTLAVQQFADLSFRDYGRPGRSARSGMLPPKLARMMINLAQCSRDQMLLDPFCGSGTVVTEAMLMGYQQMIGSDIDAAAVRATNENVAWVRAQYPEETAHAKVQTFVLPAQEIATRLTKRSLRAIVTEPTLGPPRTGREPRGVLESRARELVSLYSSALNQFSKILAPRGRVVMVIPTFAAKPKPVRVDLTKIAAQNGLRLTSAFTYERQGQWVTREITVFDKI